MDNRKSIYITFPKADAPSGWISDFLVYFKTSLIRTLNYETNLLIKETDFTQENYESFIPKSDLFVVIQSSSSISDEEFHKEYHAVLESQLEDKDDLTLPTNVAVVCLQPGLQIPGLTKHHHIRLVNFYNQKKRRATEKPLGFTSDAVAAWSKILDLVNDIKDTFDFQDFHKEISKDNLVYLGNCSTDQLPNRDDIKRELRQQGYTVLPLTDFPANRHITEEIISKSIAPCTYIIQVLGEQFGTNILNEKISVTEIEENIINKHISQNPDITRLIWIPNGLNVSEQKQQLHISRIRRLEASESTLIVESKLDEFKNILSQKLVNSKLNKIEPNNAPGTYVISMKKEDDIQLKEWMSDSKINITYLLDLDRATLYKEHLKLLAVVNKVVINYSGNKLSWLESIVKDVIKARGLGSLDPNLSLAIVCNEKPNMGELIAWLPEPSIFSKEDKQSILNFIKA